MTNFGQRLLVALHAANDDLQIAGKPGDTTRNRTMPGQWQVYSPCTRQKYAFRHLLTGRRR